MHDQRWNRVWIFFVIIALGLVLSWGQVGRNANRTAEQLGMERYLLRTEADCDLASAPCAALGPDFALVAKLDRAGRRYQVTLRSAGQPLHIASQLSLSLQDGQGGGSPLLLPADFQAPDRWYSRFSYPLVGPRHLFLRVELEQSERVLVSDFLLPQPVSE